MKIFSGTVRRSKRGSLQLSINAIVILVLAITLLGLGLTFIRSIFGKATTKLGSFIDISDLDSPPSADDPVSPLDKVQIKVGTQKEMKIGFYNNNGWGQGTATSASFIIAGCVNSAGGLVQGANGNAVVPIITTVGQSVLPSQSKAYKTILSLEGRDAYTAGTYICNMIVFCQASTGCPVTSTTVGSGANTVSVYHEKQFFLQVTS